MAYLSAPDEYRVHGAGFALATTASLQKWTPSDARTPIVLPPDRHIDSACGRLNSNGRQRCVGTNWPSGAI
jgi:hypothetical protein